MIELEFLTMTDEEKNCLIAEKIFGHALGKMSEEDLSYSIVVDQATAHFDVVPDYVNSLDDCEKIVDKISCEQFYINYQWARGWDALFSIWDSEKKTFNLYETKAQPTRNLAVIVAALKVFKIL
jgi:hypothetical protein